MGLTLKQVGSAPHHTLMTGDRDDVLIVVPEEGFKDTPEVSRVTLAALQGYARGLGKRCGLVIVANNLLAQDPMSRRVYAEGVTPDLFYGITMVVTSPLGRMIGHVATRLTTMQIPLGLAESIEEGVAWLDANRQQG